MSRKRKPVLIPATGYVDVWRHRETGRLRVKIYRSRGHYDGVSRCDHREQIIATRTDASGWEFFTDPMMVSTRPPRPQALLAIAALNAEILEQEDPC